MHFIESDSFWVNYLKKQISQDTPSIRLHLAIFVEPYLQYILKGSKTIESRFSNNRCAPYNTIEKGDIILLKKSGGPVLGICHVVDAWFYHLNKESWQSIKEEFKEALCAQDPEFWNNRKSASFATLIKIDNVKPIIPFMFYKKDRRGWVILQNKSKQQRLWNTKGIVFGFSGCIASGKTTISEGVANYLGLPRVSFGDYVRKMARHKGLDDSSRDILQSVGESLIIEGWMKFCKSVLKQVKWEPGQSLVIDGVRHQAAIDTLKLLVKPSLFLLIHININESEQKTRLNRKEIINLQQIKVIENHSSEKDVKSILPNIADLIVDGTYPIDDIILGIISWVKNLQ